MRSWEFEIVRAEAMIFVVLSRIIMHLGAGHDVLMATGDTIGDVGNSLFFFASGYLLYANNGSVQSLSAFYTKRMLRIYPLYLLLVLAIFLTSEDLPIYALGLQGVFNLPVQGFWFVGAILIYYAVYPLLVRGRSVTYMALAALTMLSFFTILHVYYSLFVVEAIYFFLTFVGGIIAAYRSESFDALYERSKRYMIPAKGLMLAVFLAVIALRYHRPPQTFPGSFSEALIFSAISISGCIMAYCTARAYGHLISDEVRPAIGGIAFSTYATYLIIGINLNLMDQVQNKLQLMGFDHPLIFAITAGACFVWIFLSGYVLQGMESRVMRRAGSMIIEKERS
jgi:peptidoglycan/LPS O-acetylase OafA/YrhL